MKTQKDIKKNYNIAIESAPNYEMVQIDKEEETDPELKAAIFRGRFLEAGLVRYEDKLYLLKQENLMNVAKDFKGIHMVVEHEDIEKDEDKYKIVGYVSKVEMGDDGWAWCEFVVKNKEAIELINQGHELSCAYNAIETNGGIYHAQEYEYEIIGCKKPIHIAIVPKGRYEGSYILRNSNPNINKIKTNIMNIFKFSKAKKETKELDIAPENAYFELEGKEVSFAELAEAHSLYNSLKKNEEDKKKEEEKEKENKCKLNESDEYEVDGKMVKVKDMLNAYKKMNEMKEKEEKKNQEDEEAKKKKEEEEKANAKKNSIDFEEMKKKKEESENRKNNEAPSDIITDSDRFKLGSQIYGSSN